MKPRLLKKLRSTLKKFLVLLTPVVKIFLRHYHISTDPSKALECEEDSNSQRTEEKKSSKGRKRAMRDHVVFRPAAKHHQVDDAVP